MSVDQPTRREFALALAAAAAAACAPRASETKQSPAAKPATPETVASPSSSERPPAGTDELIAFLRSRYGGVVPPDQFAQLGPPVGHVLQLSDRLRKVSVANDVDPFSVCPSRAGRGS